jgi:hypothetical protein
VEAAVIELTDEMKAAAKRRMGVPDDHQLDPWTEAAFEDVLAIVERDHGVPLRAALIRLVDPDPCTYDHDGICQAHGQGSDPFCAHRRAMELLL